MGKNQNCFEYKGYHTKIEFDYDSLILFGKIEGINDLIMFESEDTSKIESEFHKAVDDYLVLCEENGMTPEKEYKGVFNVRVSPETHKKLALLAYKTSETLNAVVEKALDEYVGSARASMVDYMIELPSVGEILKEEFMKPMGISTKKLAKDIDVNFTYMQGLLKNYSSLTADVALRLAKYFGVKERFFIDIQNEIDLRKLKETEAEEIDKIKPVSGRAV